MVVNSASLPALGEGTLEDRDDPKHYSTEMVIHISFGNTDEVGMILAAPVMGFGTWLRRAMRGGGNLTGPIMIVT